MFRARLSLIAAVFALAVLAQGCALKRSDNAAAAKVQMIGMNKETVLACMGIPKKKASEGSTEVWSYMSTDDRSDGGSTGGWGGGYHGGAGYSHSESSHTRSFCTVNIVMKDGLVSAVHYNGPTESYFWSPEDQCGFGVANCVSKEKRDD